MAILGQNWPKKTGQKGQMISCDSTKLTCYPHFKEIHFPLLLCDALSQGML